MSPKIKNTPHRVLLSLSTDLYELISRVALAMDKPRAEFIRDVLAEQKAILEMLATALEQAKAGQREAAMQGVQRITGEAVRQIEELVSTAPGAKKKRKGSSSRKKGGE